jgi:uncharacterized protein
MADVILPNQIDPIQLADKGVTLKGRVNLAEMHRLSELICENNGVVTIDLRFGRDNQGLAYISGGIKTKFKVICQRCLQPMLLSMDLAVQLSPVDTDAKGEQLPHCYDPLLITGELISLATIVEDEVLLNFPIVPLHSPDVCSVKSSDLLEWGESDQGEDVKNNPFRVLKKTLVE